MPNTTTPNEFKTMLRPALGWVFVIVVLATTALCVVAVVTERATLTDATPVLMTIIAALGGAVTTWVFGRSKEKIAGRDEWVNPNVVPDNNGGGADFGN